MIACRRQRPRTIALCCAVALSAPLPCAAEAPSRTPPGIAAPEAHHRAQARFFAGQKLYGQQRFAEALHEFHASYALVQSPNSHLYIGRCLRELGDVADAYDELTEVILEAADRTGPSSRYANTLRAASEERAALRQKVATLVLRVPLDIPGLAVLLGAAPVAPARWNREITLPAGRALIRAQAPGHAILTGDIDLRGGEVREVVIDMSVTEPSHTPRHAPGSLRALAVVSGGVGALGFAAFGVFGTLASSRYDQLAGACDGRCDPSRRDEVDAGRRETLASQIGLGVGVAGLAGGAALWLLSGRSDRDDAPGGARFSLRAGGAGLGGAF
jgi:hypothetical protein